MTSVCNFDSPQLTRSVGGTIPTFLIEPTNTASIAVTGGFTNGLNSVCGFPTKYGLLGANSVTPFLYGPNKASTACAAVVPGANLLGLVLASGQAAITAFSCPSITWNAMATGTYTLSFAENTGPSLGQNVFVVASATPVSDLVYATATATTTLPAVPASTITSVLGTSIVQLATTLPPVPSSTATTTVYSETFFSTSTSTLIAGPVIEYITTADTVTLVSTAPASSTQVFTDYYNTTTITSLETSTVTGTLQTVTQSIQSCPSSSLSSSIMNTSSLASSVAPSVSSMSTTVRASAPNSAVNSVAQAATVDTLSFSSAGSTLANSFTSTSSISSSSSSLSISSVSSSLSTSQASAPATTSSSSLSTSSASSVTSSSFSASSTVLTSSSSPSTTSSLAVASAIACPVSNGTVWSVGQKQFQMECFTDRQSGQIGVQQTSNFTSCIAACASTSGCYSVSYTGGSSAGWCYLKGVIGLPFTNQNVWGARYVADMPSPVPTQALLATTTASTVVAAATPSTPTPLSCPSSGSSTYNTTSGSQFLIECMIDHQGGNLATSYVSSLESCIAACDATAGCLDVSWIPGRPGACYMKSFVGAASTNNAVWGAKKIASAPASASSSASSASLALSTAVSAPALSTPSICPLGITTALPLSCPSSNALCFATPDTTLYNISCATDFVGGDMPAGLAWATSLSGCFATCAATTGCLAVSYLPASGACYMKSKAMPGVSNAGVVGGMLVRKPVGAAGSAGSAGSAATAATANVNVAVSNSISIPASISISTPTTMSISSTISISILTTLTTLRPSPSTLSTLLAKRSIVPAGGPDYTYPVLPTTTLTVGTSTVLLTSTPSPSPAVIVASTATVTTTTTITPAASGVVTATVKGAGGPTSWSTVTVTGVQGTSMVYVGGVTRTSVLVVGGGVQSVTVGAVKTQVVTGVVTRTVGAAGGVVTVTTVGCW